jgi:beta-lactamase class D
MKQFLCLFLLCAFFSSLIAQDNGTDLKHFTSIDSLYKASNVEGTLLVFDADQKKRYCFNASNFNVRYSPASTFKIFNTLVAFETGIVKDSSTTISWDNKIRKPKYLNQNLSVKRAFRYSAVWAYQYLARQAGYSSISKWLKACNYGNANCEGAIDQFWLNDSLKISVEEQLNFLIQLKENKLPFSEQAIRQTKEIMFEETSSLGKIYAKTGWAGNDTQDIGWYIGWIENNNKVYYFIHLIINKDLNNASFANARKEIPIKILSKLIP